MWDYNNKVMDYFLNPRNVGEIADADAEAEVGNMTCGDGSQMSIYGGTAAPFSPLTSAPQITRFSAPESTSNGILHVNIEVEMPQ